jgi:hypothetical protein
MKSEKIVGYVLLAVGLVFVVFPTWLAYSILLGGRGLPELVPSSGTDPTSAIINVLSMFFILIIAVWAGSIISSRGVTLIREVRLKVIREDVGEEVLVVKKEEAEKPKKEEPEKTSG